MGDNWKELQKKVIRNDERLNGPFSKLEKKIDNLTKVIKDPDKYNSGLASEVRVERVEVKIKELSDESHSPTNFTAKLKLLHDKIDSIYTLLETLSNRLNELEYSGDVMLKDQYHSTGVEKYVKVKLTRKEKNKPANPYGDDEFATPT